MLQTVQNSLHIDSIYLQTYTDDNVQNTHTYTQYTQCTIRHTTVSVGDSYNIVMNYNIALLPKEVTNYVT